MIDNKDCCDHGDNINNQEVKIDYPCEWSYKIIGSGKESVHNAVACIIELKISSEDAIKIVDKA